MFIFHFYLTRNFCYSNLLLSSNTFLLVKACLKKLAVTLLNLLIKFTSWLFWSPSHLSTCCQKLTYDGLELPQQNLKIITKKEISNTTKNKRKKKTKMKTKTTTKTKLKTKIKIKIKMNFCFSFLILFLVLLSKSFCISVTSTFGLYLEVSQTVNCLFINLEVP